MLHAIHFRVMKLYKCSDYQLFSNWCIITIVLLLYGLFIGPFHTGNFYFRNSILRDKSRNWPSMQFLCGPYFKRKFSKIELETEFQNKISSVKGTIEKLVHKSYDCWR